MIIIVHSNGCLVIKVIEKIQSKSIYPSTEIYTIDINIAKIANDEQRT